MRMLLLLVSIQKKPCSRQVATLSSGYAAIQPRQSRHVISSFPTNSSGLDVLEHLAGVSNGDGRSLVLDEDVLHDTVLDDGGVALRAVVAEQSAGVESHAGLLGELQIRLSAFEEN